MGVWDTSTPTGSEAISSGDDKIREFKSAIQDSLRGDTTEGTEAIFPGSSPLTAPVFRYRGRKGATAARPTAGQYGLFFDETRQSLQRDNGTTWEDIGTNFPAGTALMFPQPSAPTGWTKITSANDRALRVVSGSTGGETGGTLPVSGGVSHFHTVASHTHTIPEASIEHTHDTPTVYDNASTNVYGIAESPFGTGAAATAYDIGSLSAIVGPQAQKVFMRTDDVEDYANGPTGTAAPLTDTAAPVIAYLDVIWATKN